MKAPKIKKTPEYKEMVEVNKGPIFDRVPRDSDVQNHCSVEASSGLCRNGSQSRQEETQGTRKNDLDFSAMLWLLQKGYIFGR
jgi:hypothetical protein